MNYNNKQYFDKMDRYFRAVNYLSVAQLYMLKNPLLKEPIKREDIKQKIVGHWGTIPGQNFIYTHMNRAIQKFDLDMILISGPGHGGNFFLANSYLEGTYSEYYPECSLDKQGMTRFCKQFSFPYGVSSHVAPQVPGSMHEGGELGYSLLHGFGAVFDNKDLIATVIVGDGEAETGPLATSWQSNKFLNPARDGAVLPILHLNGYKISNPTVLARESNSSLKKYFYGMGWDAIFVEGEEPKQMHKLMANAVDKCITKIKKIQLKARSGANYDYIRWPMIVLRTPKGWTVPKFVDGKMIEGSFRSHQVPVDMSKEHHLEVLENWMKSYKTEELFNDDYSLKEDIKEILPKGEKRISANPHTNMGVSNLILPNLKDYAVEIQGHGKIKKQDMLELGKYIRDIFALNKDNLNYRIFAPDEAKSNRLYHVFEVEKRAFLSKILPTDEDLAKDGRIMDSFLSEHASEGWLEGYLLTGRHGMFVTYEAFARIIDSMVSQHAKWIKEIRSIPWRKPISSLNLILTSNVWQQDHNGYSHQEPGFLDHLVNKKADIVRIYLPPDANCLISCYDHIQRTQNYINAVVASKHPSPQWLSMDEAITHCAKGAGEWTFASNCGDNEPDIVLACAGDTTTLETMACASLIKKYLPNVKYKFVNVVDLMRLPSDKEHPHGLTDEEFDNLFTKDKPVVFNYHGYASLILELTSARKNHNFSVHGYQEEGSITTAFDMRVRNEVDRYHLLLDVIKLLKLENQEELVNKINKTLEEHKKYIAEYGVDIKEVTDWKWED
ncbi:MAG: phosphoketolase family protein [Clostridiales bacterium]|nr:phosphoketolase family protein [Clostridiales bacterium]